MNLAKKKLVIAIGLAVLTFAIFSPVLKNEFLNYDDPVYITKARQIQKGLTAENVQYAFTKAHASFWHPLTTLSHMLDCQLFGLNPTGHHAENLLWHIGSVVLLFLVLQRMTGALWRSAIVAALFAWHPLHVESVAWAAEKKDVLSTFFWMLTIWAYVRYAEAKAWNPKSKGQGPKPKKPNATARYFLTLVCFILGLMAKPMLVTLPFVMLLLDYWPLNRIPNLRFDVSGSSISNVKPRTSNFSQLIIEKIPFLILALIAIFLAIEAQTHGGTIMSSDRVPYLDRFENAAISYLVYLRKIFWPFDLMPFYPYPGDLSLGTAALAALVVIALIGLVFIFARRFPFLLLGWLWYCGTLVPVSGLIQVGSHAMADRYMYVPLVGFSIAVVWGVYELTSRGRTQKVFLTGLSVVVLAACAVLTVVQLRYWKNSGTLFEHALAVSEKNAVAHVQLAGYALVNNDIAKAEAHTRRALEMFPNNRIAHRMLGLVYESQKKWAEAAQEFSITLAATPDDFEALYGFANAQFHLGKNNESAETYAKVIQLMPDDAPPHNNLGNVFMADGRIEDAIAQYSEAVRRKPDYADAHFNLALAYVKQEKFAEAVPHLLAFLQQFPNDANAHYLAGLSLSRSGNATQALVHFQEALQRGPDAATGISTMTEVAFILSAHPDESVRNVPEAIKLAERATEATQFQEPWSVIVLACAYASDGRFEQAVATLEKTRPLDIPKGLIKMVENDFALFRKHQPFRNMTWAKAPVESRQ